LIDLNFTAAYVAAALATAALICDEAIGVQAPPPPASRIARGGEHPGQPDRPGYVRRPAERVQREHPTARG
jgi:hypothetical protein